jgi:hypothetical protein
MQNEKKYTHKSCSKHLAIHRHDMGRWEFHTAGHLELYALANLLYPVELQQQLQVPGKKTLDSAHHRLEDKKD